MKTFIPKDHRVMSWDPENMEKYWRQCKEFDFVAYKDNLENEKLSQQAFTQSLKG